MKCIGRAAGSTSVVGSESRRDVDGTLRSCHAAAQQAKNEKWNGVELHISG
jgi:hypothetical protein